MQKTLLPVEQMNRLDELEKVVKKGAHWFVEVGNALAEIRDSKLYRYAYKTFEEYCKEKWGWTKRHAYRLIECAPIAESDPRVTSERQARELARVEPAQREAVISKAAESGKVTAKAIKEAHAELVATEPKPKDDGIAALAKAHDRHTKRLQELVQQFWNIIAEVEEMPADYQASFRKQTKLS